MIPLLFYLLASFHIINYLYRIRCVFTIDSMRLHYHTRDSFTNLIFSINLALVDVYLRILL